MKSVVITAVSPRDARFQLKPGEGVDAIHSNPQYAYAVTLLHTDAGLQGVGLALTLGAGTEMVCDAI
ncbi:MAG TPA: mandelate racemase, partial [Chloroflexi bacterium]|nr:mandelate racemase [Chloroflexota bacterium]